MAADNGATEETSTEETLIEEVRRVIRSNSALAQLAESDLEVLAPLGHVVEFRAGTILFDEGNDADNFSVIATGTVEIYKTGSSGKKLTLKILHDGDLLGEMGLLNNVPRTATARALTDVRLLCFDADRFNEALAGGSLAAHRMVLAFARILAQRLTSTDRELYELFEADPDNPRFRQI